MKKLTIVILILGCISLVFGFSFFNKKSEEPSIKQEVVKKQSVNQSMKDAKESNILVTFVELGSINCIPCKMMQPVMDEIEEEYGDQVKVMFYDVWTDEGKPYGRKYGIRAIPTQVFLDKEGNEFFRHQGFFSKKEIEKVLKTQGVKSNSGSNNTQPSSSAIESGTVCK